MPDKPDNRVGWRHWYHITLGTYGHWLPGDPRSWRERHHRKHIPGSQRQPAPPTKFAEHLHQHAKSLLKQAPVQFHPDLFAVIGGHLLDSLAHQQIPILCLCVGEEHCHLLVQCADDEPRRCAGNLKGHVYHLMFKNQFSPWEKRSHEEPIADEAHGRWAFRYILEHAKEGAWVWPFRDACE